MGRGEPDAHRAQLYAVHPCGRGGKTTARGLSRGKDRKRRPSAVRSSGAVKHGLRAAHAVADTTRLRRLTRRWAGVSENSGTDTNVKSECAKRVYPSSEAASFGITYITSGVRFQGEGGSALQGETDSQNNTEFPKTAACSCQVSMSVAPQPVRCAEEAPLRWVREKPPQGCRS